jgi:hypothetical protein
VAPVPPVADGGAGLFHRVNRYGAVPSAPAGPFNADLNVFSGRVTMGRDRHARDMGSDRLHLVGVAAVVAVVLAVAGNWLVGTYLLGGLQGSVQPNVQAGVEVAPDPSNETGEPGSVTVTWTDRGPAPDDGGPLADDEAGRTDHLVVRWAAAEGATPSSDLGHAERAVTVTDGTWRLAAVGHGVTLRERSATATTRVRLVVTAVRGDAATVVVARTVSL